VRFARDGHGILLIGHSHHGEVICTPGEAPESRAHCVSSVPGEKVVARQNYDRLIAISTGERRRFICVGPAVLSTTFGRRPTQRRFKPFRDRRRREVAAKDFTIRDVAAVEFPVGFPVRTKRRAFQRDACEQSA